MDKLIAAFETYSEQDDGIDDGPHLCDFEAGWQAAKAAPAWVSCAERLPTIGQKIILFANGAVQEDVYMLDASDCPYGGPGKYYWSREDVDECPYVKPEHYWMELPEPPAEEA